MNECINQSFNTVLQERETHLIIVTVAYGFGREELKLGPVGCNIIVAKHNDGLSAATDTLNNLIRDGLTSLKFHY